MKNYLNSFCVNTSEYSITCRNEAILKNMPIIKFELPDDYELKFNATQYFIYPRVTSDTSVKYVQYGGGADNRKIHSKFFLGLKFV